MFCSQCWKDFDKLTDLLSGVTCSAIKPLIKLVGDKYVFYVIFAHFLTPDLKDSFIQYVH